MVSNDAGIDIKTYQIKIPEPKIPGSNPSMNFGKFHNNTNETIVVIIKILIKGTVYILSKHSFTKLKTSTEGSTITEKNVAAIKMPGNMSNLWRPI